MIHLLVSRLLILFQQLEMQTYFLVFLLNHKLDFVISYMYYIDIHVDDFHTNKKCVLEY